MKNLIPKCNSCGQPMFEVGELAGDIQIMEQVPYHNEGNLITAFHRVIGMRHPKLYQCPECKDVKIL